MTQEADILCESDSTGENTYGPFSPKNGLFNHDRGFLSLSAHGGHFVSGWGVFLSFSF
jgi:hypothetical protein